MKNEIKRYFQVSDDLRLKYDKNSTEGLN
jgi:hypothetical protein